MGSPSPRQSLWPRKNGSLYLRTPLLFDSPLPSVSADLCVLGIQLDERMERVTGAPNPASAPPSTPARWSCRQRGACLSCGAQRWALWGLAAEGVGRSADGTRSDAGECHVPAESGGPPCSAQNPAWGRGEKWGRRLAGLVKEWSPWPTGVLGEVVAPLGYWVPI